MFQSMRFHFQLSISPRRRSTSRWIVSRILIRVFRSIVRRVAQRDTSITINVWRWISRNYKRRKWSMPKSKTKLSNYRRRWAIQQRPVILQSLDSSRCLLVRLLFVIGFHSNKKLVRHLLNNHARSAPGQADLLVSSAIKRLKIKQKTLYSRQAMDRKQRYIPKKSNTLLGRSTTLYRHTWIKTKGLSMVVNPNYDLCCFKLKFFTAHLFYWLAHWQAFLFYFLCLQWRGASLSLSILHEACLARIASTNVHDWLCPSRIVNER